MTSPCPTLFVSIVPIQQVSTQLSPGVVGYLHDESFSIVIVILSNVSVSSSDTKSYQHKMCRAVATLEESALQFSEM